MSTRVTISVLGKVFSMWSILNDKWFKEYRVVDHTDRTECSCSEPLNSEPQNIEIIVYFDVFLSLAKYV